MRKVLHNLWDDDRGILEAIEFLMTATIVSLGMIVGLTALRNAIVTELQEVANATLALSQGYSFCGLLGCCSFSDGSQAIDTPGLIVPFVSVAPSIPSVVDVLACP